MRLSELIYENSKERTIVDSMDVNERHNILTFIYKWLAGDFMGKVTHEQLIKWEQISKLFPPNLKRDPILYRLISLPLGYEQETKLQLTSNGRVSSWTSTMTGLDCVAGIATDMAEFHNSCRVAVLAKIPKENILATVSSLKRAFLTLSHGYREKYPETKTIETNDNSKKRYRKSTHPDWPEKDQDKQLDMNINDIISYRDLYKNHAGGPQKQYEFIVKTPTIIDAKIIRIYRIGHKIIRHGNDDPHNSRKKVKIKKQSI